MCLRSLGLMLGSMPLAFHPPPQPPASPRGRTDVETERSIAVILGVSHANSMPDLSIIKGISNRNPANFWTSSFVSVQLRGGSFQRPIQRKPDHVHPFAAESVVEGKTQLALVKRERNFLP